MAGGDRSSQAPDRSDSGGGAESQVIAFWRLPVFRHKLRNLPAFLVPPLSTMAAQLTVTPLGYRISYERASALLVLASVARETDPAMFVLDEPPSSA